MQQKERRGEMKYFQFVSNFRPEIIAVDAETFAVNAVSQSDSYLPNGVIAFLVNTDGNMVIETENETIPFARHDFVALLPDRSYHIRSAEQQDGEMTTTLYKIIVKIPLCRYVRYDLRQVRSFLLDPDSPQIKQGTLLPEHMHLNEYQFSSVVKMMRTIIQHHSNASNSESEYVMSIAKWIELTAMLEQYVKAGLRQRATAADRSKPNVDYYVSKTQKYIEQHYTERITIPEVAQEVGVSPNYLSTLFKEGTGETIVTYLNRFRMDRLQELLQSEESETFERLCCRVGINDDRYARRLFKKYFGVSVQRCKRREKKTLLQTDTQN